MAPSKPSVTAALLLSVMALLAGCTGSESGPEGGNGTGPGQTIAPPAEFNETTGAIEGRVYDQEARIIPGAQLGLLQAPDFMTESDSEGRFTISKIPEGDYTLAVSALGFEPFEEGVQVIVGKVTPMEVEMVALPSQDPYDELRILDGLLECAVALVRTTLSNPANCDSSTTGISFHTLYPNGWPTTWVGTMVEANWESNDYLAFDYNDRDIPSQNGSSVGYYGVYARFRGQSPVHFLVERCGNYMETMFGRAPAPCDDASVNSSHMRIDTFYVGQFQEETHNLDPVCQIPIPPAGVNPVVPAYQAGCYGVGVALGLRWTNYVTIFHRELPPDIDSFTAMPDF